jgi:RHS repeat-associated protein
MAAVEIPPAIATTSTITTTYQYDKQGNRTGATRTGNPATTLTYDQANRLTAVNGTATYAYNGDGLRTAKTIGTTTTPFTWDLAVPTPLLLSDGTTSYIYGPGGQPIEQITGNTPTYLQTDQQASTRLITDATGTITGAYSYNPYGQTTAHTGTATTAMQYNGQYTDTETGYLYLRARYYDPATGQFLTRDPLTTLSGSPYAYADGNPLNASDPTGQFAQILLGGLIGGVAGAVIGGANYFVNNIFIEGKTFSWRGFAASTIGGAVNGGITGACDAALVGVAAAGCSAVGGAAGELTSELIGGEQLNIGKIGFSVVTNGVADAFVPKIGQIGFIPYKISNVFTPGVNATRQYINSFASGGFSTLATDLFNDLLDSAGSPCR